MDILTIALFWVGAAGIAWLWYYLQNRNDRKRHERKMTETRLAGEINRSIQQASKRHQIEIIEAWRDFRDDAPGDGWRH